MSNKSLVLAGTSAAGRYTNHYNSVGGCDAYFDTTTEANAQIIFGAAIQLEKMSVQFRSNSGTTTVTLRQNGGNATQTIASGANFVQDLTHIDTIAKGDLLDINTPGSSSGQEIHSVSFQGDSWSAPIANIFSGNNGGGSGVSVSGNGTNYYNLGGGNKEFAADGAQNQRFKACVLSNFSVYSQTNTFNQAEVMNLRKNSATNLSSTVTIGAAATGLVTDITHSDTLVDNDVCYIKGVNTAGSGALTIGPVTAWQTFTATQTLIADGLSGGNYWPASKTDAYMVPCGSIEPSSFSGSALSDLENVEYCLFSATWNKLRLNNVKTQASTSMTCKSSMSSVDGAQSLAIGASLSGVAIEDVTHSDSIIAGSSFGFHINSPGGAGGIQWDNQTSQLINGAPQPKPFLWVST